MWTSQNTWGGGPGAVEIAVSSPSQAFKSLCDREMACSASDLQGSNSESCVWRAVSSHSSHHLQEVLLAQFSLHVHKGGLKPPSLIHKTLLDNRA